MPVLAAVLVGFVALEHVLFLVLEMVFWQKPIGLRTFRMTREQAAATARLAANQGLYNGFLAAGLMWGLLAPAPLARAVQVFFLACVVAAGLFGAATVSRRILLVQALPAALALAAVLLS
jgi:putative membrane protein